MNVLKDYLLLTKLVASFFILFTFGLYYYYKSIKEAKKLMKIYLGEKKYNKLSRY